MFGSPRRGVKIRVTRRDIRAGGRTAESCPLAFAARRAGLKDALVSYTRVTYTGPDGRRRAAPLPDAMRSFAAAFDRGDRVRPRTFYLDPGHTI